MALLQDGQQLRDTYEVERYLGDGAFAEVYRVKHRFLGRQAMKVFKRSGMDQSEVEDLLGEAILLSRIRHPNIVQVFNADTFEYADRTFGFFTMEYVPAGSLEQLWRSYGDRFVPVSIVVEVVQQICRGLSIAHQEKPPIIHRDIKPQNILVGYETDGLRARLSDFGLARKVNPLTLHATAAGTLSFKPPETFRDEKADSCLGDIWALGTTLYLLLTDRLPFGSGGEQPFDDLKRFNQPPQLPSFFNYESDQALDRIVLKCLTVEASRRYQSARDLESDLKAWTPGQKHAARASADASSSKTVLGPHSPALPSRGAQMAKDAMALARDHNRLTEAADLMEQAFNQDPSLRTRYTNQVKLWRCGITM